MLEREDQYLPLSEIILPVVKLLQLAVLINFTYQGLQTTFETRIIINSSTRTIKVIRSKDYETPESVEHLTEKEPVRRSPVGESEKTDDLRKSVLVGRILVICI